jgi:hypothetical protein
VGVIALVVLGSCTAAPSTSAPEQLPSPRDPAEQECERLQRQLFDVAIDLKRMVKTRVTTVTYEDMVRVARSKGFLATTKSLERELENISSHFGETSPAGLRFGEHLLSEAVDFWRQGVEGLLRLKGPFFDPSEATEAAIYAADVNLESASKELGDERCEIA